MNRESSPLTQRKRLLPGRIASLCAGCLKCISEVAHADWRASSALPEGGGVHPLTSCRGEQ